MPKKIKKEEETTVELTMQAFAASVYSAIKVKYPDWAASVDHEDIAEWLEQWWPMPAQIALCVPEWARAYHDHCITREALPDEDAEK